VQGRWTVQFIHARSGQTRRLLQEGRRTPLNVSGVFVNMENKYSY